MTRGRDTAAALHLQGMGKAATAEQQLGVELDMETDELERLVALVRVAKGHDD